MEKVLTDKAEVATGDATVYEVSYLLLPSLAEAQVSNKATEINNMLTSLGGAVIGGETPVSIDLAYPMTKVIQTVHHKVTSGYFGWVKFEMSSEGILAVKKSLDNNQDILRYLIIKTVRENTLLNGKMKLQKEDKVKKDEEVTSDAPETLKEVPAEDLDKSIDDLVIV